MSLFMPDYYKDFKCTASRCRHNCCIGWEIDIDNETLGKYKSVSGDFKNRFIQNIAEDEDGAHFVLAENERCPFLNKDNLCDIILQFGDGFLCEICAKHPRFVNFYDERKELGLGLACEEAARLIITKKDKMKIVSPQPAKENEDNFFVNYRQKLFCIAQDRTKTAEERENALLAETESVFPKRTWAEWEEIYSSLENLDPEWKKYVSKIGKASQNVNLSEFEIPFEQLLCYFLYRHSESAFLFGDFRIPVLFSVLSVRVIRRIFSQTVLEKTNAEFYDFLEIIRMYSAEIEYCEENTDKLFDLL